MKTTSNGRKLIWILSCLLVILIFLVSSKYYARIDLTKEKRFSVSDFSSSFLQKIQEPVRITYYVSPELTKLYPQTQNIKEFLSAYSQQNKNILFESRNPVKDGIVEALVANGIYGHQIQSSQGNKTEYTTVYSAIMIEYLNMTSVIPFVLSDEKLEYELTLRLLKLVENKTFPVFIMCGNGMSVQQDYSYLIPWLEASGFSCKEISAQEFVLINSMVDVQELNIPLVILGTTMLSKEESEAINDFVVSGGNALVMSSVINANIYDNWDVSVAEAFPFTYILEKWGLSCGYELLNDISCFHMTLYSDDTNPVYETLNYPMWITSLSQYTSDNPVTDKLQKINFFWANPINVSSDSCEVLVYTTPAAWLSEPDFNYSPNYVTNPFVVAQSAKQAGKTENQYAVSVKTKIEKDSGTVIFVSDQYFVSTMLLDYTGSSSNLDFVVNSLLSLSNSDFLLDIRNRSFISTQLNKKDIYALQSDSSKVLFVTCILFPCLPVLFAFVVFIFVKYVNKKNIKKIKVKE